MADCGHGFPSPASCVECMADGPLPPTPRPKRDGWPFTAEFDGPCCAPCPGIDVGDRIVRMSDGSYRHVGACERV